MSGSSLEASGGGAAATSASADSVFSVVVDDDGGKTNPAGTDAAETAALNGDDAAARRLAAIKVLAEKRSELADTRQEMADLKATLREITQVRESFRCAAVGALASLWRTTRRSALFADARHRRRRRDSCWGLVHTSGILGAIVCC